LVETSDYVAALRLDGGHVALDFVNTLGGLRDAPPNPTDEHLRRYEDLVAWCARVGILPQAVARRLSRRGAAESARARRALGRALELRATVHSVLGPLATGTTPSPRALSELAEAERRGIANASLRRERDALRWSWRDDSDLDRPLWPLAHSAVELVTSGPLERLTICGRCRWLFIDESRNRSRRWCSMEECGTAVKKRRYVERRRTRNR
jgi:predicted RNA-binding Zn ribbon-like protein